MDSAIVLPSAPIGSHFVSRCPACREIVWIRPSPASDLSTSEIFLAPRTFASRCSSPASVEPPWLHLHPCRGMLRDRDRQRPALGPFTVVGTGVIDIEQYALLDSAACFRARSSGVDATSSCFSLRLAAFAASWPVPSPGRDQPPRRSQFGPLVCRPVAPSALILDLFSRMHGLR